MSGRIRLDSDEPQSSPTPPPTPEPAPPPPPPDEPVAEPPVAAAPEESRPAEPELPPDIKKRIDRLTWEKYEARRQYEDLQRQVQAFDAQRRAQALPPGQQDPEERALNRYRAEAAERDFNARCNDVFRRGSAEYADFGEAVRALNAVGYGGRPDALAAIAAMPEGHHVYRKLAGDLDNAARVLNLAPMDMAMEFARMAPRPAEAPAAPPAVTRAPEPIRPIGGGSRAPDKPLDKVSMAEFIRRRDREDSGSSRIRR